MKPLFPETKIVAMPWEENALFIISGHVLNTQLSVIKQDTTAGWGYYTNHKMNILHLENVRP